MWDALHIQRVEMFTKEINLQREEQNGHCCQNVSTKDKQTNTYVNTWEGWFLKALQFFYFDTLGFFQLSLRIFG